VVGLGSARLHELVANAAGEREISEPVAVQVAELPLPEQELDASEAMRSRRDAVPAQHLVRDSLVNRHLAGRPV
jgi:hypothetical protein